MNLLQMYNSIVDKMLINSFESNKPVKVGDYYVIKIDNVISICKKIENIFGVESKCLTDMRKYGIRMIIYKTETFEPLNISPELKLIILKVIFPDFPMIDFEEQSINGKRFNSNKEFIRAVLIELSKLGDDS